LPEAGTMVCRLGPIDVCCDAPLYAVVRACAGLGFHAPLDVRWCRLSHFLREHGVPPEPAGNRLWRWLLGRRRPERTCSCGEPLPVLGVYGTPGCPEGVGDYLLGQCRRCRTIFWEVRINRFE